MRIVESNHIADLRTGIFTRPYQFPGSPQPHFKYKLDGCHPGQGLYLVAESRTTHREFFHQIIDY